MRQQVFLVFWTDKDADQNQKNIDIIKKYFYRPYPDREFYIMTKLTSFLAGSAIALASATSNAEAVEPNCQDVKDGITVRYAMPAASLGHMRGKILVVDFAGSAAAETGVKSVTLNMPLNGAAIATSETIKFYPRGMVQSDSLYVQKYKADDRLCTIAKEEFKASCGLTKPFEVSAAIKTGANPVFEGSIEYKIGTCAGSIRGPRL